MSSSSTWRSDHACRTISEHTVHQENALLWCRPIPRHLLVHATLPFLILPYLTTPLLHDTTLHYSTCSVSIVSWSVSRMETREVDLNSKWNPFSIQHCTVNESDNHALLLTASLCNCTVSVSNSTFTHAATVPNVIFRQKMKIRITVEHLGPCVPYGTVRGTVQYCTVHTWRMRIYSLVVRRNNLGQEHMFEWIPLIHLEWHDQVFIMGQNILKQNMTHVTIPSSRNWSLLG